MEIKAMASEPTDSRQSQTGDQHPSLNLGNVSSLPAVGFISPPAWLDPAPYEFTTVIQEPVLTQQAIPLLPDFDFSFDQKQRLGIEMSVSPQQLIFLQS